MKKNKHKRICTFNCQGLLDESKKRLIADDFKSYGITAMLLQETHMKGHGVQTLTSTNGEKCYLYYSGHESKSINGVGIVVETKSKVNFRHISSRICMLTNKISNSRQISLISAYAPTLERTQKSPEETINFYNELSSVIKLTNSRDMIIIGGDFNAKTKPKCKLTMQTFNKNVGMYGKGYINENGQHLLEFAKQQNLKLTNTFFKHKPSHITTWESPSRSNAHLDSNSNKIRRNPYRNQIDYLMVKHNSNIEVYNSRSYGGMKTRSDHKPVIAEINFSWRYIKSQKASHKINYKMLLDKDRNKGYTEAVKYKLQSQNDPTSIQDEWTNIINITKQAAIETLGYVDKKGKYSNPELKQLSEKQKKLNLDINSTTNPEKRKLLKSERNQILTKMHNQIKIEESMKIEEKLVDIEKKPNDSRKMYEAVKNIKRSSPKAPLLLKTKSGLTANEEEQTKIIAEYFKSQFNKNVEPITSSIKPTEMTIPFTSTEIKTAVKNLKNNKSPGNDEIPIELIKFAPDEIYDKISSIYNKVASTGEYPKELTQGLLCALQKPGKPKGPPENLRPIILLSVLRKILAVCLMKRIGTRIDAEIPPSQAAYRKGRSTTEHVFSTKLIIERTITSKYENVYLLMHDMSKAFDSINRATLLSDLSKTIEEDELHLIKVLLNVELSAKCGNYTSKYFITDTGAPQGDCASANEFTYYLAKTLQNNYQDNEHDYAEIQKTYITSQHQQEHSYSRSITSNHINISQEYADDISEITSNPDHIKHLKQHLPIKLAERNLIINDTKTEEYEISRTNPNSSWKSCKLLGSLLDTENDIKRRKGLAVDALHKLAYIFKNKKLSINIKMRTFDSYISSIFLYNSELWTLTTKREESINSFHRRLLRTYVLNVTWPNVIKNENVYNRTKTDSWTSIISKRRIRWFGHVMRLPAETPVRRALAYALQTYKRPIGRPALTWIAMMKKQLLQQNMTWEEACIKAQNRTL